MGKPYLLINLKLFSNGLSKTARIKNPLHSEINQRIFHTNKAFEETKHNKTLFLQFILFKQR